MARCSSAVPESCMAVERTRTPFSQPKRNSSQFNSGAEFHPMAFHLQTGLSQTSWRTIPFIHCEVTIRSMGTAP